MVRNRPRMKKKKGKKVLLNKTHLVIELNWYKGNKIIASIMLICGNNILDDFIRYKILFACSLFGFSSWMLNMVLLNPSL